MSDTPERPSQERMQLLARERQVAVEQQAAYEFLQELENIVVPELGKDNLLEFRYPRGKRDDVPRGIKLENLLKAGSVLIAYIEAELERWSLQEQAYLDASVRESVAPKLVIAPAGSVPDIEGRDV